VDSKQAASGRPPVAAPGLPLVAVSCAIVYLFTAISKSASDWRSGQVLRVLANTSSGPHGPFSWLPRGLAQLGVPDAVAWQTTALGVLAWQLLIAAGYCVSTLRDDAERPFLGRLCFAAWAAAALFHIMTELEGAFAIRWFSYYMLWVAFVMFAPAPWLQAVCAPIARLRQRIGGAVLEQTPSMALAASSSCLLAWIVAQNSDLPGVPQACIAVLAYLLVEAGYFVAQREVAVALRCVILPGVAMVGLFGALNLTSVRFDYYRRAAGELSRLGQLEQALVMYRKAERYAPAGKTRMTRIDKLQRELEAHDAGLPETGEE